MRGGEGLSAYARYAYMTDDSTVIVPYMTDSETDLTVGDKRVHISARTSYPYACRATYQLSGEIEGVMLAIYLPGRGLCRFAPDENGQVTVDAELHILKEKAAVGEGEVLMLGDLMLGKPQDTLTYQNLVSADGYEGLVPLCDCYLLTEAEIAHSALRVVNLE